MADTTKAQEPGLVRRGNSAVATASQPGIDQAIANMIRTPQELAQAVRDMQEQAFILSPAIAVSSIAGGYVINRAVVAIDPTFDAKTGRGQDVYHQPSIHKKEKRGTEWVPLEVSLNKNALIRVSAASGIDITRSERTDNGRDPYYWAWTSEGTIIDFDGRKRRLPPGSVEIDYRDGSATIGEWTPAKWAQAEEAAAAARVRRKLSEDDAWKEKPQAIGGWTYERVLNARRFGLRIAEAESLNRLIRNLGIKQTYTIAELTAKPFIVFRCSPDMNDPDVKRMVMASHLGATDLLYPGAPKAATALPAVQDANVIDIHASDVTESSRAAAPKPAPDGAVELDDIPDDPAPVAPAPTFLLLRTSQLNIDGTDHYFFESQEGVTFVTEDRQAARTMNTAKKDKARLAIESEHVQISGVEYAHVVGCTVPKSQAALPDLSKV